jgi:hypothetical protein
MQGEKADDNKLHFSDFFYLHRLEEKMDLMEMKDFLKIEVNVAKLPEFSVV